MMVMVKRSFGAQDLTLYEVPSGFVAWHGGRTDVTPARPGRSAL